MHRVEVYIKEHLPDARGLGLVQDIRDLGISGISDARVNDIFRLEGEISPAELELICRNLLCDPVTQEYRIGVSEKPGEGFFSVEVAYNPGVADPVEETAMKAIGDLGIKGIRAIKTARRYLLKGRLEEGQLDIIAARLLINPIIQHIITEEPKTLISDHKYNFKLEQIDLIGARDNSAIAGRFGFSPKEMAAIEEYFVRQRRNPTDAELETLAQTWSEHCVHKTFKARIKFDGQVIDNLLKSTIMKATHLLNRPWCLSVFKDNAGVIDFDGKWALCFKVETHNHPSAIEPYGGASTGIGGVVRDIMGTGLSARPICNTDVFCFGPPDTPYEQLPPGVLHPRRVLKGVRAGVADYGNRLGIPTINGAIVFDRRYTANPLVYCGTVGLMPKNMAQMGQQKPGDLVVLVGGRTGRDGIHGVTFASEQLNRDSTERSFSSVQIGNPITEKKVIDSLMKARDKRLFSRITDCGGGGLSSAIGEMAAETGVKVYLDKVPLKYAGLSYSEIWISESQERMLLAVPPECLRELLTIFAGEMSEATVIGEFTNDRRLRLYYQGNEVCNLEMSFLHGGRPQLELNAAWGKKTYAEPDCRPDDAGQSLLKILGSWDVCSKEWVIRQYDHEVQGASVLKPLVGKASDGPGDAAVIRPLLDSVRGAIISNGICPRYADIDPYWMAASAIDEALRQIIAVGGNLERVALLDNFCWGDASRPEKLGALVRACQACSDMSLAYGVPFVSGKDSLNNEFEWEGNRISIPDTLLISALGIMEDSNRAVSMDFKQPGNLIYIIGATYDELGGSEYFRSLGFIGNRVPRVRPGEAKSTMLNLSRAMACGLVRACHDLSDGGLGVALAEMCIAGRLGARAYLKNVPTGESIGQDDSVLFSESNSRFLAEVSPGDKERFEKAMEGTSHACIGETNDLGVLEVCGLNNEKAFTLTLEELRNAWQKPLGW